METDMFKMKIKNEKPPNFEKIASVFKLHKGIVFTYGDTLYNPDGGRITADLLEHEKTHTKQQGDNPDKWWDRYLKDAEFRTSQELEAYQIQYKTACKFIKDKNALNRYLHRLAGDLSSEMYGSPISFNDAVMAIKNNVV